MACGQPQNSPVNRTRAMNRRCSQATDRCHGGVGGDLGRISAASAAVLFGS
jgi:hypothetical protein